MALLSAAAATLKTDAVATVPAAGTGSTRPKDDRPRKPGSDGRPFAFLSYARGDLEEAERLRDALEAEGIAVWWDGRLEPGAAVDQQIEQALADCGAAIVLFSAAAIASRYVMAEAVFALEKDKVVPVRAPGFAVESLPFRFRGLQCVCASETERIAAALASRGLRGATGGTASP